MSFNLFNLTTGEPENAMPEDIEFINSMKTIWIVHGYKSAGSRSWVENMKKALFIKHQHDDQSPLLVVVDWSKYAKSWRYSHVICYIPEIAEDIFEYMTNEGVNVTLAHMIGHSLGAHVCGVVGNLFNGTIDHITGRYFYNVY